jgi:p-aminobenzoyl-glutamate transporter AbgT
MLPYSIAFAIGWTALLAFWLLLGIALGRPSGMVYPPA